MMRHLRLAPLCAGGLAVLFVLAAIADEPKAVDGGTLVVIDGSGKEMKIKGWTFSQGTEQLTWLAPRDAVAPPPEKGAKAAPRVGPLAFTFREENSTSFKDGVVTLVPVDRVRSVDYDNEKQTVTMRVATSAKPEDDARIVGSTEYKGVNKITLEAEVDKGDLGVAEVKFLGGTAKGSIQGLRFPAPRVPAAPPGRSATVLINDDKKPSGTVTDLQALYRFTDETERLSPLLFFKKTLKIDMAKIKKLTFTGKDGETVTLTPKEGEEANYTLLPKVMIDGKEGELVGLVGKVPAGYRLFPPHTLAEIEFDTEKKPDEERKPDEKKPDEEKKPEKLRKT